MGFNGVFLGSIGFSWVLTWSYRVQGCLIGFHKVFHSIPSFSGVDRVFYSIFLGSMVSYWVL